MWYCRLDLMNINEFFGQFHPVVQALFASSYAWGMTAIGAAAIFVFKTINRRLLDAMLGFAAGVMMAASFWSLLKPSIELAESLGMSKWIVPTIGFLTGGAFLRIVDLILPHLHLDTPEGHPEGIKTNWQKTTLMALAITLHNIPEGIAIGVAFGAASAGIGGVTVAGAIALAIGIGIQDFPEGFAVSVPFRRAGKSRFKSFFYGMASGLVEPIGAVIGAAAVLMSQSMLPFALSFAAGAMIFVTIEEVIPEAQSGGNADIATSTAMIGFALMMVLDVALS